MLHHLEHRHHQEDDIDLSKQTRITVLQAALKRASGFPCSRANGREIVRWGQKKEEKEREKKGHPGMERVHKERKESPSNRESELETS